MQDHTDVLKKDTQLIPDALAWRVCCPECGTEEVERGAFDEETGTVAYDPDDEAADGDDAAVTVHPDTDSYISPLGTRGGFVEVDLWCAAGHVFQLVLANHKGAEYVGIVRNKPGT